MEAKSHRADVGDVDSSSSLALVNTDLSPAILSLPKATQSIVGSHPVTPVMFFSMGSTQTYCSGKHGLASQVSAQPLTAEQPTLLLFRLKGYCLISKSEM